MCLNLQKLYLEGKYKETTYKGKKGQHYAHKIYAKCGYCQQCIAEKANNWVIRNHYESKAHEKKCFITLTYKHSPIILIKKDLQNYKKRLRKLLCKKYGKEFKIRTYDAGEYGTLRHRPHYHLIIYGWEEEENNLTFGGYTKRGYPYYFSKTIDNTWKFGRATYQKFDEHEAPYIALYETAREKEKFHYNLTLKKAKELRDIFFNDKNIKNRYTAMQELEKLIKEKEKEKCNYIKIKEFNSWSTALGWNEFEKEYFKDPMQYAFKEYIEDKEFYTPTPWIKKLADLGEYKAIKEMQRRSAFVNFNSIKEAKAKAIGRLKTTDEIIKWNDDKEKTDL